MPLNSIGLGVGLIFRLFNIVFMTNKVMLFSICSLETLTLKYVCALGVTLHTAVMVNSFILLWQDGRMKRSSGHIMQLKVIIFAKLYLN